MGCRDVSYSYAGPDVPALAASVAEEIAALHARHYPRLVRLAVALTDRREVAEEVVQDAFVATLRRWDRIRNQGRCGGVSAASGR